MKIEIIKFDGETIEKEVSKIELRKNQVSGWLRLDSGEYEDIKDIATIKIIDE